MCLHKLYVYNSKQTTFIAKCTYGNNVFDPILTAYLIIFHLLKAYVPFNAQSHKRLQYNVTCERASEQNSIDGCIPSDLPPHEDIFQKV